MCAPYVACADGAISPITVSEYSMLVQAVFCCGNGVAYTRLRVPSYAHAETDAPHWQQPKTTPEMTARLAFTATGASVASYFLLPKATVSLGASGAVFGLFAVSVLVKLSFNLKKLIECGILGQFVIKQLLQVRHMVHSCV